MYHIPCQNGVDMVHFYYHKSVKYLYQFWHFAKISEKSEMKGKGGVPLRVVYRTMVYIK